MVINLCDQCPGTCRSRLDCIGQAIVCASTPIDNVSRETGATKSQNILRISATDFSRGADRGHPALSCFPLPVAPIEPDRD